LYFKKKKKKKKKKPGSHAPFNSLKLNVLSSALAVSLNPQKDWMWAILCVNGSSKVCSSYKST
jgi:hypothetical protein